MVCGLSSLRSRSSWKYLRPNSPTHSWRAPLLDLSFSRPSPAPTLFKHSLAPSDLPVPSPSSSRISFSFSFSIPLSLSSLSLSLSLTHSLTHPLTLSTFSFIVLSPSSPPRPPLVRKIVIGPSATSDHGGKQPRESELRIAGKDWGLCRGRVIAVAATVMVTVVVVAAARDSRECLPYITGAAGKYKGHGALPSTLLGASRPSRRSEL